MAATTGAGATLGGSGTLAHVLLQLDDPLARLAQPLIQLAEVLLKGFRLLGGPVQVLVDLVDVVALEAEPKFNGAKGVEDG